MAYTTKKTTCLLLVDTSGSTWYNEEYYNHVEWIYKQLTQRYTNVIIYEWAHDYVKLTPQILKECCKNRKSFRCLNYSTILSNVVSAMRETNQQHKTIDTAYIITDGGINSDEFERTTRCLRSWVNEAGYQPHMHVDIYSINDVKLNESIALCLGTVGDIVIVKDGETIANVGKVPQINSDIDEFFKSIDIELFVKNLEYQKEKGAILRLATVGKSTEWIKMVLRKLNEFKRRHLVSATNNQIGPLILSKTTSAHDIIKQVCSSDNDVSSDENSELEKAISRLYSIINQFRNMEYLYLTQTTSVLDVPISKILDDDDEEKDDDDDRDFEKEPIITCPITMLKGTQVYVVFKRPNETAPNEMSKSDLKLIQTNPFTLLKLFDKDEMHIDRYIGSFFCTDPHLFNGVDPKTRASFIDHHNNTEIVYTLVLGTSGEAIAYTNWILNAVLFNRYKIADSDIVFLCLWYHLKYKTKRTDLSELIAPMEAQLKERFAKPWNLSLGSNGCENMTTAPKWCALWYILHELAYAKQLDQSHSCTIKYLQNASVVSTFLKDLYDVDVSSRLLDYLRMYNYLLCFAHIRSKSSQQDEYERLRRLRALKCKSIRIMESDYQHSQSKAVVSLTTGKIHMSETYHKASTNYTTIPLDEAEECNRLKRFAIFPNGPKDESEFFDVIKLVYGCLPKPSSPLKNLAFFFDDEARNEETKRNGITNIGFDPSSFQPTWYRSSNEDMEIFIPTIHEHTLRPQAIFYVQDKDGIQETTWHQHSYSTLGVYERFVSSYAHFANFVCENSKIPSFEEALLYIYATERAKTVSISLKEKATSTDDWFDKHKVIAPIQTLPANFDKNLKNDLANFTKACMNYPMDYIVKILTASLKFDKRKELEKMKPSEFENWLQPSPLAQFKWTLFRDLK